MNIQRTIDRLQEELTANLALQREIEYNVSVTNRWANPRSKKTKGPTKITVSVLAYPYFKDARGFTHIPNEDTIKKNGGDEPDVYAARPKDWTREEKDKLKRLVRRNFNCNFLFLIHRAFSAGSRGSAEVSLEATSRQAEASEEEVGEGRDDGGRGSSGKDYREDRSRDQRTQKPFGRGSSRESKRGARLDENFSSS
jgi:hypothetical protein